MKTRPFLARTCLHRPRRGLYAPELLESRIAPATFTVTTLADAGPGSLRQAVLDANDLVAHPGPDTIKFQIPAAMLPGTIKLTSTEIAITDPVTIKGPGIDVITVSGDDTRRIFNIDYPGGASLVPTVITGLSLIDGFAGVGFEKGGAIYSREPLTLKNVVIASSYAKLHGGGVALYTAGKVSIDSCRIVKNEAKDFSGGGLYLVATGGISVVKSTIADNEADSAGGVYAHIVTGTAPIVFDKLIVSGNTATVGSGGGLTPDGPDEGKLIVKNSLITGNTAALAGGGLYCDTGNLIVKKTTFSRNTAARGGAVAEGLALSMDISGSRFLANKATDPAGAGGGALYLQGDTTVKIARTLFSGNMSAAGGGAVSTSKVGGPVLLDIKGSSFLGNTAATTGGALVLKNGADLTLKSSVLSGNIANNGGGGALYALTGAKITAKGNKFTENKASGDGGAIHTDGNGADAVAVTLQGNLFSANVAVEGGAVKTTGAGKVTMKGDKVIGNVATTANAGGLYLASSTGGITISGLLVQGNVAGDGNGGGLAIFGNATVTGCKILDNAADFDNVNGGVGGGIFVTSGTVAIIKCTITGNVADKGGGIFATAAGTTADPSTKVIGNNARTDPNKHIP